MIYSALFLAIAIVLPTLTGQIPEIGKMLSPMHLPVMLLGFLCGAPWAAAVGAIAPILRMLAFGAPTGSTAIGMIFELAAYGALTGAFYRVFPKKTPYLYLTLLLSMLGGRLVLSLVKFILNGIAGTSFSFFAYFASNVVSTLPAILLQALIVPPLAVLLRRFSTDI
jgi:thiamine transporter ThiT